ncbi:hypothetical protein BDW02DRAFT_647958 [Decorospora gaudefroyi]|uniref:Uncharacterized protein n=1 Tax=Decorospora gaudefroyi TaxID=184978 RepID=A0A6A5KHK2_9PLEO|nr:hypothetical protein BDW02DRAFT_647958 [Decorospora gaudefroyi]
MAMYMNSASDEQTLIIDLGASPITNHDLTQMLRKATYNYRHNVSTRVAAHVGKHPPWEKFHETEMKHYKWLRVRVKPSATHASVIPSDSYVSGVICPECKRWSKLGSACSRCTKPLQDEAGVFAERDVISGIMEGALATLGIIATIGTMLFLTLLEMS